MEFLLCSGSDPNETVENTSPWMAYTKSITHHADIGKLDILGAANTLLDFGGNTSEFDLKSWVTMGYFLDPEAMAP